VFDLLVVPDQLPAAIETVRALPWAPFVLDHGGKPGIAEGMLEPWRELVAQLAAEPNVVVKLSGLATEADHATWDVEALRPCADTLLELFGPARVMFGSDWPVCLLAGSYAEILGAAESLTDHLSDDERYDVFGGTAARWYGLDL
jgi:L-fuconolactonase